MKKMFIKGGIGLIITTIVFASFPITTATAATLTDISDTMNRLKTGVYANHDIKFKMDASTTIINAETVTVKFNGFTSGSSATLIGDWTIKHDADGVAPYTALTPTTDWTFTDAGTSQADPTYTFTFTSDGATAIGTDKYIEIVFTNATNKLINPSADIHTIDVAGTFGDTGSLAVYILSDDQVQISATVDPILAFAIEGGYCNGTDPEEPGAVDFGTLIPNFYHKLLGEKPAYAGIEFTGQPAEDETVTVCAAQSYVFKDTEGEANAQSYFVLIGDDFDDTAENLYRAVNNTDGDNVRAGLDPADPSQVWFVAVAAGTGGNSYEIDKHEGTSLIITKDDGANGADTTTTDDGDYTFVDGQAGGNYKDDSLGFGVFDDSMGNESYGTNLVISTNGVGGYVITVQDETNGLYNTGAGWGIPDWGGQYGFGIWAKARSPKYGECAPAANEIIADAYDVDATPVPGTLSATAATLASYSGPTSKDHISIEYVVRIDADYPAGDYSDTLTYVATSTF